MSESDDGIRGQNDEEEPLAERLRKRYGFEVDPEISLATGGDETLPRASSAESSHTLQRLAEHGSSARYKLTGEIARGGMGAILKVWDEDLRRELAMKVVLIRGEETSAKATEIGAKALGRFMEEAQITGQLEHPGIVPVHELGLDADGRIYFTMQLVKGRDLAEIFALVSRGEDGWTTTRALGVMLTVCEAMAYAHSKGVIHRDLKPANVMVGRFGEVYVMDWGLGHVLGEEDKHDIRLKVGSGPVSLVRTDRAEEASDDETALDGEVYTMDGDVVGTPTYMSPEQAMGKVAGLDGRTDVYSVGAMLYRLLAGRAPFAPEEANISQGMVLMRLLDGPPRPLDQVNSEVPAELLAICDKAMERDLSKRYAGMRELADDLRAFLENRVVHAYETGAVAELRKWVRRNRGLAAAIAATVVVALGAMGAVSYVEAAGRRDADAQRTIARRNEKEARTNERIAQRERANVLRLSAFQKLEDLVAEAETLWPATPERIPAYEAWIGRAEDLAAGLQPDPSEDDLGHYAQLEELRARALSPGSVEAGAERREWAFADDEDRWWHAQLEKLVVEIEAFADSDTGLIRGTSARWGWGLERRLEFASGVAERTVDGDAARAAWAEAIDAVRNVGESPQYGGLEITAQLGLLPIGPDPDSGLWEFAHVLSGDVPERGDDGRLILTETTGLVFVLIPGGEFTMGSQRDDPALANYDEASQPDEGPVHGVELDAFFLAKHEMTQGQWLHFTGRNPSRYDPTTTILGRSLTLLHPVEQVSWQDCSDALHDMGLVLPTEAQWEYAARATTDTPWCTGEERESLVDTANLADRSAARGGATWPAIADWPELEDGWAVHAPVGALWANGFGLHDVVGNVREWCREGHGAYDVELAEGDAERLVIGARNRVFRGGSFSNTAAQARSAYRGRYTPDIRYNDLGLRPARPVVD